MTECWRSSLPSGQKMVLLALCDNANDQGECYPSISTIAEKCSMSERSVFYHISTLENLGILCKKTRNGRSTIYHLDHCKFCTTANSAPLQPLQDTPAKSAPPPLQPLHHPPAKSAPITINEPSIEPSLNHKAKSKANPITEKDLPSWLSKSDWDDFVQFRISLKKKMSDFAERLMVKNLIKIAKAHSPEIALDQMHTSMRSGWADVYPPKQSQAQSRLDKGNEALHQLTGGLLRPKAPAQDYTKFVSIDMENANANLLRG